MYYPIHNAASINSLYLKLDKVAPNADELFDDAILEMQETDPHWHKDITVSADEGVKLPPEMLKGKSEEEQEDITDRFNHHFGVTLQKALDKHTK